MRAQLVDAQPRQGQAASAPASASSSASASVWLTRRHQLPPSAVRTASSRSRSDARTSSRFATLAQAMSKQKDHRAHQRQQSGAHFLDYVAMHGLQANEEAGGFVDNEDFAQLAVTWSTADCARSSVTPSFSRPIARQETLLRLALS
jgi:hypothetical protein